MLTQKQVLSSAVSPGPADRGRGTDAALLSFSCPRYRLVAGPYAVLTKDTMPQTYKRKRSWSRAVFSNLQRKGLEKRFEIQKYVTKPDRKQLAAMLGLTDAQVSRFRRRRTAPSGRGLAPGLPPPRPTLLLRGKRRVLDFSRPRTRRNLRQEEGGCGGEKDGKNSPSPKMYVNNRSMFILANRPKNSRESE